MYVLPQNNGGYSDQDTKHVNTELVAILSGLSVMGWAHT